MIPRFFRSVASKVNQILDAEPIPCWFDYLHQSDARK